MRVIDESVLAAFESGEIRSFALISVDIDGGNGNDGTLVNMEDADWVDGVAGKCLSFDGVDEYVSVPDNASLDITDAITMSAWVYLDTFPAGNFHIIRKENAYIFAIQYDAMYL